MCVWSKCTYAHSQYSSAHSVMTEQPADTPEKVKAAAGSGNVAVPEPEYSAEGNTAIKLLSDHNDNASDATSGMATFRGKQMSVSDATVLKHLIQDFSDHFGMRRCDATISLDDGVVLQYNEKYKVAGEGNVDRYYTKVSMTYMIDSTPFTSPYFCIDNLIMELIPAKDKNGNIASNHGETWINVYFPQKTLVTFANDWKAKTGWELSNNQFVIDKNQKIVSVRVMMDAQNPPSFIVMVPLMDDNEDLTGEFQSDDRGTVQSCIANSEMHALYKFTGLFTAGFSIPLDGFDPSDLASTKGSVKGRISLMLISTRVFSAVQNYSKISLGRNRGMTGI